ncbi:hypothetical protein HIM_07017 [Hirsutella minnesotensis 3608]|uniref:F-box domain-containing protein n=1 Tax=Hirsutella minnesotensis 3608 TaxID=1043627 RepID=A0A0F8A4J4_9HYPO|nr:hypothetical protein HIM_07017 [Hirsutella minnesotensis 3608]
MEAHGPAQPVARRRASLAKTSKSPADGLFDRLPDEIIEQILLSTDPNGFASLVLVNSKWRAVSQRPHLYLHHLRRCPSFLSNHATLPPPEPQSLRRLRHLFVREVKRSLFDAYLRPTKTVVKLVSRSISSSSCPGGEGMQYSASLRGHKLLAYNSSRIYLIDLRSRDLLAQREFKIMRRPLTACVTDDAGLLAVLSTEVQVDLYDLQSTPPKRKQSLALDNVPRTIALSSCGTVLAAAYDGGIEVTSLDPSTVSTDRRAVKCDGVDALAFSLDGLQLLGTTTHSASPSTVVLTAPYYDPGSLLTDSNLSSMWTTSILFPNTSRDCSHAILLPRDGDEGEAEWTFTYDRSFETFRAVRLDDLRNGTTYFTGPLPEPTSQSKLLPCTLPASTANGELVSAGFSGNEIWIYGVPGDLDVVPEPATSQDNPSEPVASGRQSATTPGLSRYPSSRTHDSDKERVPQWQILCDKLRNNFISGCKIAEVADAKNVKWVSDFADSTDIERLVVTARGVSGPGLATEDEEVDFADGGRIVLLDFEYGVANGTDREVVIEVGNEQPETLEEKKRDIATEVALVRRRTVAQRPTARSSVSRIVTSNTPIDLPSLSIPAADAAGNVDGDPLVPRVMGKSPMMRVRATTEAIEGSDELSVDELEALDAPYAHASPRSGTTLRRAATAVAANRRLHPRTADGRPIQYRRADGRAEHPHESDADNWEPPPPPYQKEDPGDMPAFLRGRPVAPLGEPPSLPFPSLMSHNGPLPASCSAADRRTEIGAAIGQRRRSSPGLDHDYEERSLLRVLNQARSRSTPSIYSGYLDMDDLYDVSPPDSPHLSACLCDNHQPATLTDLRSVSLGSFVTVPEPEASRSSPALAEALTPPTMGDRSFVNSRQIPLFHDDISSLSTSFPTTFSESRLRRRSNPSTWPLPTMPFHTGVSETSSHPSGTEMHGSSAEHVSDALPLSPSLRYLHGWERRSSLGRPGRFPSSTQDWPLTNHQQGRDEQDQSGQWETIRSSRTQVADSDRPLIISTPGGISGSHDPPGRRISGRRGDAHILAPVPRNPRLSRLTAPHLGLDTTDEARAGERRRDAGVEPEPDDGEAEAEQGREERGAKHARRPQKGMDGQEEEEEEQGQGIGRGGRSHQQRGMDRRLEPLGHKGQEVRHHVAPRASVYSKPVAPL